jgi:cytochrome c-type biogenesis protein CcmH/NrfF
MAAPAPLMLLIVPPVFHGFLVSTVRFDPPVLLQPGQWVFLVALPVVAFLVAALLVERAERRAHLIGLGRAAERQARLDRGPRPS